MIYIAISTFNSGKTISGAIESLIRQESSSWRAHIIDGGSQDNTVEILQGYMKLDKRITLEILPFRSTWRMSAIRHLKDFDCEYFMWLDADDFLDQRYLLDCINELEHSASQGCIGRVVNVNDDGVFEPNHIANYYSIKFLVNPNRYRRMIMNFLLPNMFGSSNMIYSLWRKDTAKIFLPILLSSVDYTDFDRRMVMHALKMGSISQLDHVSLYRRLKSSPQSLEIKSRSGRVSANPYALFFKEDFANSSMKNSIVQHLEDYTLVYQISFLIIHFVRVSFILFHRVRGTLDSALRVLLRWLMERFVPFRERIK